MKKIDGFFVTILILVTVLAGIFYYSYKSLNYFENNPELQAKLERKKSLINLAEKIKKIKQANLSVAVSSRNIASIPTEKQETDFTVDGRIVGKELAEEYYLSAKAQCYELNKELDCLGTISKAVTHFPESDWTAESLVMLIDYYYRTKRISEAREILKVLKQDFKSNKSIQQKVIVIERHIT